MSSNEVDDENCTPPEIREAAKKIQKDLLPKKSRDIYDETYRKFVELKTANKAITSENCLKVYFKNLIENYKPSIIWSIHSKLKSTIQNENISIDNYKELIALISQNSKGYQSKKPKIFTTEQINLFLETAPDQIYLAHKVNIYIY